MEPIQKYEKMAISKAVGREAVERGQEQREEGVDNKTYKEKGGSISYRKKESNPVPTHTSEEGGG